MSDLSLSILVFARVGERFGADAVQVSLPAQTSAVAVLDAIAALAPDLRPLLDRSRVALDEAFVSGPLLLTSASRLAVIPPVSGG